MEPLSYFSIVSSNRFVDCGKEKMQLLLSVIAIQRQKAVDVVENTFLPDVCEDSLKRMLEESPDSYSEVLALVGFVCSLPNPEDTDVNSLEMNHIQAHGVRNKMQALLIVSAHMLPCQEADSVKRINDIILKNIL